jgi:hypothetical protein
MRIIDSLFSQFVMRFKKHFFELLVIFLSVMLAFFTDNWRENRQDIRQDHEDFNLIIQEINYNLRLDSIELDVDVGDIKRQIEYLELLINLEQTFKKDSLSFYLARIMNTHWPDYNVTGLNQLRNSKSMSTKSDSLINSIHDYYLLRNWLMDINPIFFSPQIEKLRDYLINRGLPPVGAAQFANIKLEKDEIEAYMVALKTSELTNRLKHLHNNRLHMLEVYQIMQRRCFNLLELFRNDSSSTTGSINKQK